MDKEHMELRLARHLSVEEFVKLAEPIWGEEGRELARRWCPRVLFLAGAGASRSAPVSKPVMSEFMKSFIDGEGNITVPAVAAPHLRGRWESICGKATQIVKSATTLLGRQPDLEELLCLSHISRGRDFDPLFFQTPVNKEEAISLSRTWDTQAFWEFHKLMVYLLFEVYSGVTDEAAGTLYGPVLRALMELGPNADGRHIVPIITTNYDRCIEGAIAQWNRTDPNSICLVDGFLQELPQGQYGPRPGGPEWVWTPAVAFRGDMSVTDRRTGRIIFPAGASRFLSSDFWNQPTRYFAPYFKIHGSLNWIYNQSILVRQEIENWLWIREELPLYAKLRDIDWPQMPLLKPYLWEPGNKTWFTNAYQQTAYNFLQESLKSIKAFVFAGYSFRDQHLLNALKRGLEQNPAALVIAIDPAEALNQQLTEVLCKNKLIHIRAPLSHAADQLRDAVSSLK